MEHIRTTIRRTLTEMASKENTERFAQVRQLKDPLVQRYVAALDAAQRTRDIWNIKLVDFVPNVLSDPAYDIDIQGEQLRHVLHAMRWEREAELTREAKERERQAKEARKKEREQKKSDLATKVQRGLSNPILRAALDNVGIGFHEHIVSNIMKNDELAISNCFDSDGKFTVQAPDRKERGFTAELKWNSYKQTVSDMRPFFNEQPITSYAAYVEPDRRLKPNWKDISQKRAELQAKLIVDRWKEKMAMKLGEVIERKGGADIKVNGLSTLRNSMHFTFADGSSFTMQTQPVYAVSKLGKDFVRFPTTFHKVQFMDGTLMDKPSSERMQAEFGISDKTASVSATE